MSHGIDGAAMGAIGREYEHFGRRERTGVVPEGAGADARGGEEEGGYETNDCAAHESVIISGASTAGEGGGDE